VVAAVGEVSTFLPLFMPLTFAAAAAAAAPVFESLFFAFSQ